MSEEQVKKICKKGAISELGLALNEEELAKEKIKDIKDRLTKDYGSTEASRIVKYAKLIQKDTYEKTIAEYNEIEEIHEEIIGG